MPIARTPASLTRRTLLAALPSSFFPAPGLAQALRPAVWAQPVSLAGLNNLYRVTPGLYRAAQPDAAGFANLAALGVHTVISLRQTVDDAPLAAGSDLALHRIPMKTRYVAETGGAKVVLTMQALYHGLERGGVLVHCHHGADRTGLICALYRLLSQGWTRDAAVQELIAGGFGFHPIWGNIPRYLRRVDLDDLRARIAA